LVKSISSTVTSAAASAPRESSAPSAPRSQRNLARCHAIGLGRAASTPSSRRESHDRDWISRYVSLVRDATGEAERLPRDGRALSVLDLSGGERSSESGMQHLSLLHADREFAVRVF
jgi:hypothetical protein